MSLISNLEPLLAALVRGDLKKVTITVTRKRDGVYADVAANTGKHTFGVASFVPPIGNLPKRKPTAALVLTILGRRLSDLRGILDTAGDK